MRPQSMKDARSTDAPPSLLHGHIVCFHTMGVDASQGGGVLTVSTGFGIEAPVALAQYKFMSRQAAEVRKVWMSGPGCACALTGAIVVKLSHIWLSASLHAYALTYSSNVGQVSLNICKCTTCALAAAAGNHFKARIMRG
jgi:hypothetical protein